MVNATDTGVNLEISATGMAVGDTIQLKKNGANFGTTHTVSTTEITNGKAVIISAVKLRTLSVASTAVLLTSPTNTTFVKVGLTETGVNLEISATGMAVGDTIQLKKNGANFMVMLAC
jgi:hypothetical protein